MVTFNIEKSKRGIPCMWERGGGMSNTGDSRIIADSQGQPKKAIYIRNRGELSCGRHALIPINVNDYIIQANHHRRDFNVYLYQVKSINLDENYVEVVLVNEYSEGQWGKDNCEEVSYEVIEPAIAAAMDKATCYHCRTPHYIAD